MKKTDELFVIQKLDITHDFFYKDSVFLTREEAEKALIDLKESDELFTEQLKVETLTKALEDISYTYY